MEVEAEADALVRAGREESKEPRGSGDSPRGWEESSRWLRTELEVAVGPLEGREKTSKGASATGEEERAAAAAGGGGAGGGLGLRVCGFGFGRFDFLG